MNLQEVLLQLRAQREAPQFLLLGAIEPQTVIKIRQALAEFPRGGEVDVILHSGGGSADDAFRIVRSFRTHFEKVNIIIPFWAKSAATLVAFGANRIVFDEFGELGPIDAQIKKESDDQAQVPWDSALNVQASLQKIEEESRQGFMLMFEELSGNGQIKLGRRQLASLILDYTAKFYQPLVEKIDTYELGRMDRALKIGHQYAVRILSEFGQLKGEQLHRFLKFLVYECPDHGFIVDYTLLSRVLDNVHLAADLFGAEYAKELGRLSVLLMTMPPNVELVGWVDDVIATPGADDTLKGNSHVAKAKSNE